MRSMDLSSASNFPDEFRNDSNLLKSLKKVFPVCQHYWIQRDSAVPAQGLGVTTGKLALQLNVVNEEELIALVEFN